MIRIPEPKPLADTTDEELAEMATEAEGYSLVAYPPMVRELVAEVGRLRGLLRRVAAPGCPTADSQMGDSFCVWCGADATGKSIRHETDCPWPEVAAACPSVKIEE